LNTLIVIFYINEIQIFKKSSFLGRIKFPLKKGDIFTIDQQILAGNSDFGGNYNFRIESFSFNELNNYFDNDLDEIKKILSEDYFKHFGKVKTEFYFGDKVSFYIDDNSLSDLFKSQNIKLRAHESNRFRNKFTFLGF